MVIRQKGDRIMKSSHTQAYMKNKRCSGPELEVRLVRLRSQISRGHKKKKEGKEGKEGEQGQVIESQR